jgi:hypothetical protein
MRSGQAKGSNRRAWGVTAGAVAFALALAGAPSVANAGDPDPAKVKPDADLPAKEKEILQLGIDAMMTDRPAGKLEDARKKLELAIKKSKGIAQKPKDASALHMFLGAVYADLKRDKDARAQFVLAIQLDPEQAPAGGLSSPAIDRIFAEAKQQVAKDKEKADKLAAEKAAKAEKAAAKAKPGKPVKPGLPDKLKPDADKPSETALTPVPAPPVTQAPIVPVDDVGSGRWAPGIGVVQGPVASPAPSAEAPGKPLDVPSLPYVEKPVQSGFVFSVGTSIEKDRPIADGVEDASGTRDVSGWLLDIRLGPTARLTAAPMLKGYLDGGISMGGVGSGLSFFVPTGDLAAWRFSADVRAGVDLDLPILRLGPRVGYYYDYFKPTLIDAADEVNTSGSDKGPLYGAHAALHGGGWFFDVGYLWKVGVAQTGRYRRLELGIPLETHTNEIAHMVLFWDARETSTGVPNLAGETSLGTIIAASMPIRSTIGLNFRFTTGFIE